MSQEDLQEQKEHTAFVRGLPFDFTDAQLHETFEDIGPVRRAFVVTGRNRSQESKGFGFVVFAASSDLTTAVEQFDGKKVGGRTISVEVAAPKGQKVHIDKKKKLKKQTEKSKDEKIKERRKKKPEKQKKLKEKKGFHSGTSKAVLVTNIPEGLDIAKLRLCAKAIGKVESVIYPSPESSEGHLAARITFGNPSAAQKAVKKLTKGKNNSILGNKVKVILFRETSRLARLIIHNLPFRCSEETLRKTFEPFGSLKEVHIPRKPTGEGRGFGFVEYDDVPDASKALEAINMTKILNRTIAVDWSLSKKHFLDQQKNLHKEENKPRSDSNAEAKSKTSSSKGTEPRKQKTSTHKSNSHAQLNRDFSEDSESEDDENSGDSQSDEDIQKEGQKLTGVKTGRVGSSHNDESDSEESDSEESETDEDMEDVKTKGQEDIDDSKAHKTKSEEKSDKPLPKKIKSHDVDEGKTIFIRNLPFDAKEGDVFERFREFGEIKYAKITMDKVLNRSRGTAFVKFEERKSAENVIEQASQGLADVKVKKNSIVSNALSFGGISLGGRVLNIAMAVRPGQAKQLQQNVRSEKDNKNTHLAREGLILPDSEDASALPKAELERRQRAWTEKKTKLKNPNYVVSRVRLSVQNLPLQLGDKQLKSVFLDAAKEVRENVSGDQFEFNEPVIKQVIIARDKTRLDRTTGKPRSKRFGFVEFKEHMDALLTLRYLNGLKKVPKGLRRFQVEFALDDQRKLHIRKKKREVAELRRVRLKQQEDNREQPYSKKQKTSNKKERKQETRNTRHEKDTNKKSRKKRPFSDKKQEQVSKRLKSERHFDLPSVSTNLDAKSTEKEVKPKKQKKRKKLTKRERAERAAEKPFDKLVDDYKKRIFGSGDIFTLQTKELLHKS